MLFFILAQAFIFQSEYSAIQSGVYTKNQMTVVSAEYSDGFKKTDSSNRLDDSFIKNEWDKHLKKPLKK